MMDPSVTRSIDALRSAWADARAAAAVEMAIILPVLLLILFGTFEFARYMYIRGQIEYAVELTVRYAYINRPACTPISMQALVTDSSRLIGVPAANVTVTASVITNTGTNPPAAISPPPESCQIDARYPFSFFGFIDLTTLAIQAVAAYPCSTVINGASSETCPTS